MINCLAYPNLNLLVPTMLDNSSQWIHNIFASNLAQRKTYWQDLPMYSIPKVPML